MAVLLKCELLRLFMAALLFFTAVALMLLLQMTSDRLSVEPTIVPKEALEKPTSMAPLRDLLFTSLPSLVRYRKWLPDMMLLSVVVVSLVACLGFPQKRRLEFQRVVVARRLLIIITLLYLLRSITFIVTTVPSPINDCKPAYVRTPDFEDYVILFVRMASGKVSACTDNIYSGHTTIITVMVLAAIQYSGIGWIKCLVVLQGIVAVGTIVMSRLHYTVDVVVAVALALLVFQAYHMWLLLYIDASILRDKAVIASHTQLYEERRLCLRGFSDRLVRFVAWVDGVNVRAAGNP